MATVKLDINDTVLEIVGNLARRINDLEKENRRLKARVADLDEDIDQLVDAKIRMKDDIEIALESIQEIDERTQVIHAINDFYKEAR